jgi:hypothetical protein
MWSRSYETLSPEVRATWSLREVTRVADGVRVLMHIMKDAAKVSKVGQADAGP